MFVSGVFSRSRSLSITPLSLGKFTKRPSLFGLVRSYFHLLRLYFILFVFPLQTGPLPLLCRRFAGPMERLQAEAELINRVNSTYLVRHRSREYTEYAISIK